MDKVFVNVLKMDGINPFLDFTYYVRGLPPPESIPTLA
jgi:hypothetical protein